MTDSHLPPSMAPDFIPDIWPPMLPFHKAVETDFLDVNQLIIDELHSDVGLVENIGHYLIEAGGKRLRPLLVLLVSNAMSYHKQDNHHLALAAIIEFIHSATLLHDDVVDTSSLRRGRLTANAKWGNAPSVLVGDFLYSRAFQMMVRIGNMEIMSLLADTTNTISEGEVQQLINAKNPDIDEDTYYSVIYKKTAALFEAACETAAVLTRANAEQRDAMKRYGYHLGMAFQLVDDALDYQGNSEELGKNVGDDLNEGKPTLPLIQAMKMGSEAEKSLITAAIREGDASKLEAIVKIVAATGSLAYTTQAAERHAQLACECLKELPQSSYSNAMRELASFSVHRRY